jgi:hypothetical protein
MNYLVTSLSVQVTHEPRTSPSTTAVPTRPSYRSPSATPFPVYSSTSASGLLAYKYKLLEHPQDILQNVRDLPPYYAISHFLEDDKKRVEVPANNNHHSVTVKTHLAPVLFHPAPVLSHPAQVLSHPAPVLSHPAPVLSHPAHVLSHPAHVLSHPAPVLSHPTHDVPHPAPVIPHPVPVDTHSNSVNLATEHNLLEGKDAHQNAHSLAGDLPFYYGVSPFLPPNKHRVEVAAPQFHPATVKTYPAPRYPEATAQTLQDLDHVPQDAQSIADLMKDLKLAILEAQPTLTSLYRSGTTKGSFNVVHQHEYTKVEPIPTKPPIRTRQTEIYTIAPTKTTVRQTAYTTTAYTTKTTTAYTTAPAYTSAPTYTTAPTYTPRTTTTPTTTRFIPSVQSTAASTNFVPLKNDFVAHQGNGNVQNLTSATTSTTSQKKVYFEFGKTRKNQDFKFPSQTKDIIFESDAQQKLKEKRKIVFAERNQNISSNVWQQDEEKRKLVNALFWNALKSKNEIIKEHGGNELLDWTPGVPNFPMKKKAPPMPVCMHPAQVANGKITCEGKMDENGKYIYGSVCVLSCLPGHATAGHDRATCDKKGAWMSSSRLECVEAVAMVIGGWNLENGVLADVEIIDPKPGSTCARAKIAPLPSPRRGLVAEWVNGRVLACGGVNETAETNKCWSFDPLANAWFEAKDGGLSSSGLVVERHFASSAVAKSKMYAIGGRDGRDRPMAIGSVESDSNGQKWIEEQLEMSQERAYHCATSINDDTLILTGGYSYNSVVGVTQKYNLTASQRWERIGQGNLNNPRYLHACSPLPLAHGGPLGIIVAGGYSTRYLKSAEIFDPQTGAWMETGDMSVARQGASMVVLNRRPTVFGGFHSMRDFPTSVEQYDLETGSWILLHNTVMRVPRRYFAVASVPRTLVGKC